MISQSSQSRRYGAEGKLSSERERKKKKAERKRVKIGHNKGTVEAVRLGMDSR